MINKKKIQKITTSEAFGVFLKLNGEYDPDLFREVCEYLKCNSDNQDETLGFCLALHAFSSFVPAKDIFEAWKNHGNRREFFRIDLFKRKKEENLSAHSTQLALLYPDEYSEFQEIINSKAKDYRSTLNPKKDSKYDELAYAMANIGNPVETFLLGLVKDFQVNNHDIAVEYEIDDCLCVISAYSLFRKYGYNFGEEDV